MPQITRPQSLPSCKRGCTGWCVRCCPGSGSGRRSCCYGWRSLSYVTSGPAAPTKDAAPPAVKAGLSRHPELVVVVLGQRSYTRKSLRCDYAALEQGSLTSLKHAPPAQVKVGANE